MCLPFLLPDSSLWSSNSGQTLSLQTGSTAQDRCFNADSYSSKVFSVSPWICCMDYTASHPTQCLFASRTSGLAIRLHDLPALGFRRLQPSTVTVDLTLVALRVQNLGFQRVRVEPPIQFDPGKKDHGVTLTWPRSELASVTRSPNRTFPNLIRFLCSEPCMQRPLTAQSGQRLALLENGWYGLPSTSCVHYGSVLSPSSVLGRNLGLGTLTMDGVHGPMGGLQKGRLSTVILWCRRDLRVTDNPALNAALMVADNVVSFSWRPSESSGTPDFTSWHFAELSLFPHQIQLSYIEDPEVLSGYLYGSFMVPVAKLGWVGDKKF